MPLDPARTVAELQELRALTATQDGAQRVCWTETWKRAREWFAGKLADLPVEVEQDEAGNLWATLAGDSDRALLIGGRELLLRLPAGREGGRGDDERRHAAVAGPVGEGGVETAKRGSVEARRGAPVAVQIHEQLRSRTPASTPAAARMPRKGLFVTITSGLKRRISSRTTAGSHA